MKRAKTTYWILIVLGLLSVAVAIYQFYQGRTFDNWFFSGMIGLVCAGTGFFSLRELRKKED